MRTQRAGSSDRKRDPIDDLSARAGNGTGVPFDRGRPRMRKLGTLTIGQAPRSDITPILDAVISSDLPRCHAGVLDGLSKAEIERDFGPRAGAAVLITKLLDGSSVVIDRSRTEAAA